VSNAVYPSLPGLTFDVLRTPEFKTQTQRSVSGRELRATMQQNPLYTFSLTYDVLRASAALAEFQTLVGFFLARQGSFDSFLFTDPVDNAVTDQGFGAGDGITFNFQLTRAFGGGGFTFSEPVQNVNALTNIKVSGVTKTSGVDFNINSTGLVSFANAPASNTPLTWSGSFYYRCRFVADTQEASNFMNQLWSAKKVDFVGATGNKV
jgi:uncharacterized protein (TIGR02217 family)